MVKWELCQRNKRTCIDSLIHRLPGRSVSILPISQFLTLPLPSYLISTSDIDLDIDLNLDLENPNLEKFQKQQKGWISFRYWVYDIKDKGKPKRKGEER